MMKWSLLSSGAALLSINSNKVLAAPAIIKQPTGYEGPASPPTNEKEFEWDLIRMPTKKFLPGGANDLLLEENGGVAPNGTVYPQITGNDALTTYQNSLERIVASHQYGSGDKPKFPPQLFYMLNVEQATHHFYPHGKYAKGSIVWGYDGIYPGPTFKSTYGKPILVRIYNRLFNDPKANGFEEGLPTPGKFGTPHISTHLHNGHTGSESDGNPTDVCPPFPVVPGRPDYPDSIKQLRFRDHHYPMFRAGLNPALTAPEQEGGAYMDDGDVRETVSTLWYHDHCMDSTAANVYKGLVGFHLFFDEFDSGNENDPGPKALKLPSDDFDIPLLIQDKRFDEDGQLLVADEKGDGMLEMSHQGLLGDKFVVNGRIQPKLSVLRRKYRFRLLNAGPSRFYKLFLWSKDAGDSEFQQISNDESLLKEPVTVKSVLLSVAERADVVVDFKNFKTGDKVYLVNRLIMRSDGTGPRFAENGEMDVLQAGPIPEENGDQILLFEIGADVLNDPSQVPNKLRESPDLPAWVWIKDGAGKPMVGHPKPPDELKQLKNHNCFEFNQSNDLATWLVNQKPFEQSPWKIVRQNPLPGDELDDPDHLNDPQEIRRVDGEIWTIKNEGASSWSHPVHIHLEEFHILWRWRDGDQNPTRPPAHELCKKDVLRLDPNEEVTLFIRFRDFLGKYPIHCHNVIHEDFKMMRRFDVVGDM